MEDKVLISRDLFYQMLDAIEDGHLRQHSIDEATALNEADMQMIADGVKWSGFRYPREMREYRRHLISLLSK